MMVVLYAMVFATAGFLVLCIAALGLLGSLMVEDTGYDASS